MDKASSPNLLRLHLRNRTLTQGGGANASPSFMEEEMDAATFKKPFDVAKIAEDLDENIKDVVKERSLPKEVTKALLTDRNSTHGSFEDNARISQGLKEWMRGSSGWSKLTDVEREAMDMIALKFSRVLSGKSLEKQHWEDIVGYGQLALNLCV